MPITTAQHKKSLKFPAFCELLPIRQFMRSLNPDRPDGIFVRTDGSFVAGFRINGGTTYFADDESRDDRASMLKTLLTTVPDESMRVQFRYEVRESTCGDLDRYASMSKPLNDAARWLDDYQQRMWREQEAAGEFLTRTAAVYFIWNPRLHEEMKNRSENKGSMVRVGAAMKQLFMPISKKAQIELAAKKHFDYLSQFESYMAAMYSSLTSAGLKPERMSDDDLFAEVGRAVSPLVNDRFAKREPQAESLRYVSDREQLIRGSLRCETTDHVNIDGLLWSAITLKQPPDQTNQDTLRNLITLGIPMVISTHLVVPNQQAALEAYKKTYRKAVAAQQDMHGNPRTDLNAQVKAESLLNIQHLLMTSSEKTTKLSFTVVFRTSRPANTQQEYDEAEKELAERRQQILNQVARMSGAVGESEIGHAQRRILIGSLPGCAEADQRDHDLLTSHASDLVAIEVPWQGTPRTPLMMWHTRWRNLMPFSPFDSSLENANMIVSATSGTGKSVLIGKMLLDSARLGYRVSIIERGDSFQPAVSLMEGKMITMSLDGDQVINPFDLPAEPDPATGKIPTRPSKDHLTFLRQFISYMIGTGGNMDADLLDSLIVNAIEAAYTLVEPRGIVPTLSTVRNALSNYRDRDNNDEINSLAKLAAVKLSQWVGTGPYARLLDRPTTVKMDSAWMYFNIEKLKDDQRLSNVMSLLIARAMTTRANGMDGIPHIVVFDESWAVMSERVLAEMLQQLFRTARKRNVSVIGSSQAVEDFTGTPERPNEIGAAILATTSIKIIGRQKGNTDVLRTFLHFNEPTIAHICNLPMTLKGRQSEFTVVVGENAETTQSVLVILTPPDKWILSTFPRERLYRDYFFQKNPHWTKQEIYSALAERFPNGLAELNELEEERSGEVLALATASRREQAAAAAAAGSVN